MNLYRICRAAYRALDGAGARRYGGRWNEAGLAVVYTSGSLALAALEYLVHLDPAEAPDDLIALTITLPDEVSRETLGARSLPSGWAAVAEHPACRARGTAWVRGGATAALFVPSAAIPEEQNVLLNPAHPDFRRVRVTGRRPFKFDPRLLD